MSILSFRPVVLSQPIQTIQPMGMVILPNIVPPDPPIPPLPPVNPINSSINDTSGVIYNKVSNKIVDNINGNLLNGMYVSKNTNIIPQNLTTQNILNINRYSSGTTVNLGITDNTLSITNNLNIYFWIYVIYNGNLTKPITILTKGSNNSYGEYTVQILPNKLLSFYYTNNGIMHNLRSVNIIQERTLIFVSIIKTTESVGIYLNNRSENVQKMPGIASATNNPLLIGSGYNSSSFNGFIDNLMISNNNTGTSFINQYFSYVPTSMLYQFTNGAMTYNGYNVYSGITGVQPINVESAKFICTQLENNINGFSLSNDNKYLFYINYNTGVSNIGGAIYEKINTLNMANNYFTKLLIEYPISKNVSFEETTLIDGYIKSYTGEVFYFVDGVLYEYNVSRGIFTISNLSEIQAFTILSIIVPIIGYRYSFGQYQYFTNVKNMKENNSGLNNTFVRKLCNYLIGGISTLVNLSGHSNAGTFRFYSDIQYLNVDSNKVRSIDEEGNNKTEILINKRIATNTMTQDVNNNINEILINKGVAINTMPQEINNINETLIKRGVENNNENFNVISNHVLENNIYVYTGQNILSLLNNPTDIFVNNLPTLDSTIPYYLALDKEIDIIETLMTMNVTLNKHIIVSGRLSLIPKMYNFSIISNTQTKLIIDNKEYKINCNTPQHIVFHYCKNYLDIEIQFYYNKLNQVCKFILIQP
jgi:hypothetical protein